MNIRLAILTAGMLSLTSLSALATQKQYRHLSEVVGDLDRILAADEQDGLINLMPPAKEGETSPATLPSTYRVLKHQWRTAGPFTKLYSGRDFPTTGKTFKLGGHEKELGHVHIDFTRTNAGWVLQSIYECR